MNPPAHIRTGTWLTQEATGKYTAARIGGVADAVYIARDSLDDLAAVVRDAWKQNIPVRVIGGGANILIADEGVRGLLVVNHVASVDEGNWHDDRNLCVTGGMGLLALARWCATHGYRGMEWAIGVPGTVGGALVNNAGAHGGTMGDYVCDIVVLEPSGPKLYTRDEMQFTYRSSLLKHRDDRRFLVLMATFALPRGEPEEIRARMEEYSAHRKSTQPPGASLGSIFKNPPGDFAGRLIESCGLKGFSIGGAQVSPVHANFFVNTGGATAHDYRALIQHVQAEVQRRTHVHLEPEIEFVGDWPS
jgi:UDP-N-acetylmuramate dehydrogenase